MQAIVCAPAEHLVPRLTLLAAKFGESFVEGRRRALEQTIERLVAHPQMSAGSAMSATSHAASSDSLELRSFLEASSEDMSNARAQAERDKKQASGGWMQSLFKMTVKDLHLAPRSAPPDPEFDSFIKYLAHMENCLADVRRFHDDYGRQKSGAHRRLGNRFLSFCSHRQGA